MSGFLTRELRAIHSAVMFFTRIPLPSLARYEPDDLQRASAYFPLIGWIVGGVAALVWWAGVQIWPPVVASLVSLAATLLLTGGFHEDGFADTCDGFGGGTTRERIMEIMRDSRIGAFGAISLVMILALKWQSVAALPMQPSMLAPALILAAHTLSRGASVTLMTTLPYVQLDGKAKPLATSLRGGRFVLALVLTLAPLALIPLRLWWTLIAVVAARAYMAWRFKKRIGGYTGDCLGATQQVCEVAFYLCALALLAVL